MDIRVVPHTPVFCSIENRAIHKQDRLYGANCPHCGIPLPVKGRYLLVTVDDDGTIVSSELAPKPPIWKRTPFIVGAALVVVVVALAFSGVMEDSGSSSGSRNASGSGNASSSGNEGQLAINRTWSGGGVEATSAFRMGGDYRVTASVTSDCYYSFRIVNAETDRSQDRVGSMTEPGSVTTNIYAVPVGRYYLDVNTGPSPSCPWTVTLNG